MITRRGITLLALAVLALLGNLPWVVVAAHAAEDPVVTPTSIAYRVDETEILILEVLVERYLASRGILGYRHEDRVLLPVGELAAVLELAITVDPQAGLAEGWINEEKNRFRLDVPGRSVTVDGHQMGLDEPCLYVDPDDIYVDSEVLSRWWPLNMEVDLRGMRVKLAARSPVPLVSRLEREKAWESIGKDRRRQEIYPLQKGEYRTLGWPFLDATATYDANRSRSVFKGSLLGRADVARMSMTGFLGYQEDSRTPWTGWLRAERTDPEGDILGPLNATYVAVGDVIGQPSQFVKGTTRGRGVRLSNRPIGAVTEFGATDVTGDAPPGWEAELYRDGYLHAIQTVPETGHYTFTDIPLHTGVNTMRVVLYGPNGQQREEVRTVNIASSMWKPGSLHYDLVSHQSGESVLGSATTTMPPEDLGHWIHSLSLGYGLTHGTSLDLEATRRWVAGRDHDYLQARLLRSVDRVLLEGRGIKDRDGGHVLSASMQTRVGGHSILLSQSYLDRFATDESHYEQSLRYRSEARISGAYRRGTSNLLNYRLDWTGSAYDGDSVDRRDLLRLYLGRSVGRFHLGHDLDYSRTHSPAEVESRVSGNLQASGFVRGTRVRLDTDYDLRGDPGVNSVGIGLNRHLSTSFTAQLLARRQMRGLQSTSIQGNLDWHLNPVRLGLRAGYDTESKHYIGLSATTSLARSPKGGWLLSSRATTQHGAALARTYIDLNDNGVFDAGDQPMPEVSFGRNSLWRDIRTDGEGLAFLPGVPADRFVNVLVNLESVEDPYLVTESEGRTTLIHAGGVAKLDFPFHMVGEIEGLVLAKPSLRPLRNVGLELVNEAGERVASAVSEFDGYYVFDRVKPGTYSIRVVMTTLRDGVYAEPDPEAVAVPAGGDYVEGPTIYLERIDGFIDEVEVAEAEPEPVELAPIEVVQGDGSGSAGEPGSGPGAGSGAGSGTGTGTGAGTGTGRTDRTAAGTGTTTRPATPRTTEAPARATVPQAWPAQPVTPQPAAPVVASAPTAPVTGPTPEVSRTLHLIHELLHQSQLFAR